MKYTIAAIPTTYKGVSFLSRLEATWAAFFDLCGWDWQYEPCVLQGWCPDFRIRTGVCAVYAEVKPIDLTQPSTLSAYNKAINYCGEVPVLLLGDGPIAHNDVGFTIIERDRALAITGCTAEEVNNSLRVSDAIAKWREADNIVMGVPPSTRKHSIFSVVK